MAVTQPNLTISVSTNDDCTQLIFEDVTGEYNALTNTGGWGLPAGPDTDDVTTSTLTVTYNSLGTSIVYDFTIASNVITAATLAIGGGTPADIFDELPSTVWPFESANTFNLVGDYGVTIPEFQDEVFTVAYNVTGEVAGPESFDFTTTAYESVSCHSRCCLDRLWLSVDPSCACSDDKLRTAMLGESYIMTYEIAAESGDLTKSLEALEQLRLICENVEGCGC